MQGREIKASEWAETISPEQKKEIESENGTKQLYFTTCIRIHKVNHRVRIVVLWKHANDREPKKILVTNRTTWDAASHGKRVSKPVD